MLSRGSDRVHPQRPCGPGGESARTLANGDLLRIQAITPGGLLVRRALDADPRTGQRRWTDRHFLYASYADAELGYVVTDHTAQGRTVPLPKISSALVRLERGAAGCMCTAAAGLVRGCRSLRDDVRPCCFVLGT